MKYEVGEKVIGKVSGITEYGIFVRLDDDYTGLIHISEISEKFVTDIHDYVQIGDDIKVRITEVDDKQKHLKLSIKNFNYKKTSFYKNNYINETPHGFQTLYRKRPFWIKEYLKYKKICKYY